MKVHFMRVLALSSALAATTISASAACETCGTYGAAQSWGAITATGLSEASGIAASRRNPGVLWVHNDGARDRLFAVSTNGVLLGTLNLNRPVEDVEDIAVGPGPSPGTHYIYVGDIGAGGTATEQRAQVRLLRVPEPRIDLAWTGSPKSLSPGGVETFTLSYPDGEYDSEALLIDPVSTNAYVITKQDGGARVYRAHVGTLLDGAATQLAFERSIPVAAVSGGDISDDGSRIALRREEFAATWGRCSGETVGAALARAGVSIPVVGPPVEPNGEGLAFLPYGVGYVTVSEGSEPVLSFFASFCPSAPRFSVPLTNRTGFVGGAIELHSLAIGNPPPAYTWRFNGQPVAMQTGPSLLIGSAAANQAGVYEVTASNLSGSAISSAAVAISTKPDLRITEVQSSTAPSPNLPTADWWELTSFESATVDLTGWRFNDNTGDLADPFVIPAGTQIGSGETLVFVEGLTPAEFSAWWGAGNLPSGLEIITYEGAGLSLGAGGDGVRLWNNSTSGANDTVASVNFGAASNGVTFSYDPATGVFGAKSVVGVNGALKAASSPDIGSPGRIQAPAAPPSVSARLIARRLEISFSGQAGRLYVLEGSETLAPAVWEPLNEGKRPPTDGTVTFSVDTDLPASFYRVTVR